MGVNVWEFFVRILCRSKLPQQWNPTVNCSEGRSKLMSCSCAGKMCFTFSLGFWQKNYLGNRVGTFWSIWSKSTPNWVGCNFYVPFTMVRHKWWVEDVCRLRFKAFWGSFACVFVLCFLLGAIIWGEIPPKWLRTPKIWVRNAWKSTIIMYQIRVCICIVCVYIYMYIYRCIEVTLWGSI